jgi:hypothetical protein
VSQLSTLMYGPLDDVEYLLDGSTEMSNTELQAAICRVLQEVRKCLPAKEYSQIGGQE